VEGRLALAALLSSPYPLVSVLALRRRLGAVASLGLPAGATVYVASDEVMAEVAGFDVHRGLLGIARRLPPLTAAQVLSQLSSPLVVVVEGVNDQENLGAIFRNAAAFGAGGVFASPTCTDPLYRRSIRVSLGQVLRVPFARLEPWPAAVELLRKRGFVPVALTPARQADSVDVVSADLHGLNVALVVGAEGAGLSPQVMSMCRQARIPMAPGVDSINVAAATAVALHCFSAVR